MWLNNGNKVYKFHCFITSLYIYYCYFTSVTAWGYAAFGEDYRQDMHGSKFQENRINNDVSEGLFFNANSAIFQLYHEENKLIFNEMMIAPLKTHYPDSEPTSLCSFSFLLSVEATNTNFVVFGLTRLGLEPTIYRTRGEHTNHYTTDAVACI